MSDAYEIFEVWVEENKDLIGTGKEIEVPVKDLDTLGKRKVLATIDQKQFPEGAPLRVVNDMGEKRGSLFIKIIKELEG
ncbi:MAG: hypothetical protein AB1896_08695 [Thermodesulfobacteriota bacterium]